MADLTAYEVRKLIDELYRIRISDSSNKVVRNQLIRDLDYFNTFLQYAHYAFKRNINKDEKHREEFVRQIRQAVYDVEDDVDTFVTLKMRAESRSWFCKLFSRRIKLDDGVAKMLRSLRNRVEDVYGDHVMLENLLDQVKREKRRKDDKPSSA